MTDANDLRSRNECRGDEDTGITLCVCDKWGRGLAHPAGRSRSGPCPSRTDPTAEDPGAADWLRRFVREVVTVNPVTRDALSSIQIFLIEYALDCVDWEALARDPRFRHLDWSQARLTSP